MPFPGAEHSAPGSLRSTLESAPGEIAEITAREGLGDLNGPRIFRSLRKLLAAFLLLELQRSTGGQRLDARLLNGCTLQLLSQSPPPDCSPAVAFLEGHRKMGEGVGRRTDRPGSFLWSSMRSCDNVISAVLRWRRAAVWANIPVGVSEADIKLGDVGCRGERPLCGVRRKPVVVWSSACSVGEQCEEKIF